MTTAKKGSYLSKEQFLRYMYNVQNSFKDQSLEHQDGWGILIDGHEAIKGTGPFHRSDVGSYLANRRFVSFVAHVRRATHGGISLNNTHPFKYRKIHCCHNGHIIDFDKKKESLHSQIPGMIETRDLGDTDTELFFRYLIGKSCDRSSLNIDMKNLARNLKYEMNAIGFEAANFIISMGNEHVVSCMGKELHLSENTKCLTISSEPMGKIKWRPIKDGTVLYLKHGETKEID
tara:strand:+ start:1258 stop:1953 length:696 start_codon:yes stop_codon:yes gene_type:complete